LNSADGSNLASDRPVSRRALLGFWLALIVFYALLWSPWWYPLSDSALYLSMARVLARGEGWAAARELHRDVRPLTPLLLAVIMKLGGSIGAMYAVMIALMLAAHGLAFLAMRRWFNERIALMAVAATAGSWWVYANAFTIMTEPLFLVFFWGAMSVLRDVRGPLMARSDWVRLAFAALLLAFAWETRVSGIFSVLALGIAGWMRFWQGPLRKFRRIHVAWLVSIAGTALACALAYKWQTRGSGGAPRDPGEAYHLNLLVGVRHPLIDLPVSAGRWVIDVLAAPFGAAFDLRSATARAAAGIVSIAIFAVACAGWIWLLRTRRFYAAAVAAANFLPYVLLWGTRIKPRYMTPITPILFVQLWAGLAMCLPRKRAVTIGGVVLGCLLAMNLALYAIEVRLRVGKSASEFYDAARGGAFAELIDIGGYLQRHCPKDAQVWVNWPPPSSRPADANFAPDKRIVQFLADREVRFIRAGGGVHDPADRAGLDAFVAQVAGDWAIVYYDGLGWPAYHLPRIARRGASAPSWWQLFHRHPRTGRFEPVVCPIDRDYVRGIPGWNG
jgi:hypothetical protein